MHISSVGLENFTSFRDRQKLEPLGPVAAIVGPNNVGKSNIFQAIRLLTGDAAPFNNVGDVSAAQGFFYDGDTDRTVRLSVGCTFTMEEWAAVPRTGGLPDPPTPVLEHVFSLEVKTVASPQGGFATPHLSTVWATDERDVHTTAPPDSVSLNINQAFKGSVLHVPSQRRLNSESVGSQSWSVKEPFDGRAIKSWLHSFHGGRTRSEQARLERFKVDLRSVAGFEDLDFIPSVTPNGAYEILVGAPGHYRTRLEECGAGVQAVFIILAALYQKPSRIVLVDDVEAALHPTAQATFARTVASRVKDTGGQVIFATHSPSVLEAVPDDSIFEVRREDARSVVRAPSSAGASVIDALRHLGYRPSMLQLAEVVFFVEGPSDEAAIRAWWRTLFGEVPEPAVAVFSLGGGNLHHLKRQAVEALGRPVVLLLDSDRRSATAPLKPAVERLIVEMDRAADVRVLHRRELENYFSGHALQAALKLNEMPTVGSYERLSEKVHGYGKMAHAGRIAAEMTRDEIPEEIVGLLQAVREMSGQAGGQPGLRGLASDT